MMESQDDQDSIYSTRPSTHDPEVIRDAYPDVASYRPRRISSTISIPAVGINFGPIDSEPRALLGAHETQSSDVPHTSQGSHHNQESMTARNAQAHANSPLCKPGFDSLIASHTAY